MHRISRYRKGLKETSSWSVNTLSNTAILGHVASRCDCHGIWALLKNWGPIPPGGWFPFGYPSNRSTKFSPILRQIPMMRNGFPRLSHLGHTWLCLPHPIWICLSFGAPKNGGCSFGSSSKTKMGLLKWRCFSLGFSLKTKKRGCRLKTRQNPHAMNSDLRLEVLRDFLRLCLLLPLHVLPTKYGCLKLGFGPPKNTASFGFPSGFPSAKPEKYT